MEYLFNEPVEIEPDNLYKIIETLIQLDAEHHWLMNNELRLDRAKDTLFQVYFYNELIGNVGLSPHTSSISRVAVWVQPLLNDKPYILVPNIDDPLNGEPTQVPNKTYKTDLGDELLASVALRIMRRLADGIKSELHLNVGSEHRGRYRLTKEEVILRKGKVKEARKLKKENPDMYWKQIADQLGIPYSTLRDWRRQY